MARTKVEPNIYLDEERKLYYVSLYYGRDIKQEWATAKSKSEAREILYKHKAAVAEKRATPKARVTLAEHLGWYLEHCVKPHREKTTLYAYERMIENHLVPALGVHKLDKLTTAHIQEYITAKTAELSPNTVIKHLDLLHSALAQAVSNGQLNRNPAEYVIRPRKIKNEVQPCTIAEVQRALELAKEDSNWFYIALVLAAFTGMRRGEIMGLRWENVDLEHRILTVKESRTTAGKEDIVKRPKTAASVRYLRIEPPLAAALEAEYKRQQEDQQYFNDGEYNPGGYVVITDTGKLPNPNSINNRIDYLVKTTDFPDITPHQLRHTVASIAHATGASAFETQHALGHSSTAVTLGIYTHLYQTANDATMSRVAAALTQPKEEKEQNNEN